MDTSISERSYAILKLAREEAYRLCHEYIGTEHLLLGIISETHGAAAETLKSFGITLDQVRSGVEKVVGIGPPSASHDELPVTPRAKQAIKFAHEEAAQRGSRQIDPEHLLRGIIREGQGVAIQLLCDFNAPPESVLEEISRQLSRGEAGDSQIA